MIQLNLQHSPEQFSKPDQLQISQILEAGQVIVYPTDTLYGLGVDASSEQAVARLYLRSEEHTSELQSHSFISYAVFCLTKKTEIVLPSAPRYSISHMYIPPAFPQLLSFF